MTLRGALLSRPACPANGGARPETLRRRATWLLIAYVLLATGVVAPAPARASDDGMVAFPLGPWADDVAWLPSGEVVTLTDDVGLSRIDLRGRRQGLRMSERVVPSQYSHMVVTGDGTVVFSAGGRVLRRAPDGSILTVAGRVQPAHASGDGGPAVGAGMEPAGLAVLADGSLLIADVGSHRVRRVDLSGQITTVAGTGKAGSSGDGGPATEARLTAPTALAALPDGSYLIAEGIYQVRIRRVDAQGRITTVAGRTRSAAGGCPRSPIPASSFRIGEGFGDIAATTDGGFLLSTGRGVFRVSATGVLTTVSCGPRYPLPAAGIYTHGRRAGDVLLDGEVTPVAAADDGSVLVGNTLLEAPGGRRLAVALAPETLATVHRRLVEIESTGTASVRLRAYRDRRLVLELRSQVGAGRTELRLPRRLGVGIHTLQLTAEDAQGRAGADRLRVFGQPRLTLRQGRRFIQRGFDDHYIGEGDPRLRFAQCHHRGARVVQCRVYQVEILDPKLPKRSWWRASATIRRDGVLSYRIHFGHADKPESSVVRF